MGDLDDPSSGIRKLIDITPVTKVRAPEQNTGPNVLYIGADDAVIDPMAAPVDSSYIWADPDPLRLETREEIGVDPVTNARTTLNTAHARPWGWRVWTYLWTKSVSAGVGLLAALLLITGASSSALLDTWAPFAAAVFLFITAVLLVWDLKRPDRFWFLLDPRKINRTSWLAIGGIFLGLDAGVTGLWFLAGAATQLDLAELGAIPGWLAWPAIPAAVMAAGYTAFLFGQAEGRDLWQSKWLFWHLQAQAVTAGAGGLLLLTIVVPTEESVTTWLSWALVAGAAAHIVIAIAEVAGHHSTQNAELGARAMMRGRYARTFWFGSIGLAVLAAAAAIATANGAGIATAAVAGILAQVALLLHEQIYVKAGQDAPLS